MGSFKSSRKAPLNIVAEFISPQKRTLLVLQWVIFSRKVSSVSTQLLSKGSFKGFAEFIGFRGVGI